MSQKNGILWKNGHNIKIQDICYQIGTEIFRIEEEMTEKMKPEVARHLGLKGGVWIWLTGGEFWASGGGG